MDNRSAFKMENLIELALTALIALMASIGVFLGALIAKRHSIKRRKRRIEKVERLTKDRLNNILWFPSFEAHKVVGGGKGASADRHIDFAVLRRGIEQQVTSMVAASPGLSKEEVQTEIDKQLSEFQQRLARLNSSCKQLRRFLN